MARKPEGPMADRAKALLKKQEHGVTMGESKIHLGRFAKNFAQVKQKAEMRNRLQVCLHRPSKRHTMRLKKKSRRLSQTRQTRDYARKLSSQQVPF